MSQKQKHVKHQLVRDMQHRMHELTAAQRAGDTSEETKVTVLSIQEEIAYLARIQTPSKNEVARLRSKFGLPGNDEMVSVATVPPAAPVQRVSGRIRQLPAHQPVVMAGEVEPKPRADRERYKHERYCEVDETHGILLVDPRRERMFFCPKCEAQEKDASAA